MEDMRRKVRTPQSGVKRRSPEAVGRRLRADYDPGEEAGGMEKLRVGLLFGGRSVEHEVSLASATSILRALDPMRYEISLVAIDQEGRWHLGSPALPPEAVVEGDEVTLPAIPGERAIVSAAEPGLILPAGMCERVTSSPLRCTTTPPR